MKKMAGPLEQLPDQIDLLVTAIIADAELPWAITIANKRNIPVATPCTVSATGISSKHVADRGDEARVIYAARVGKHFMGVKSTVSSNQLCLWA
ncbi:hypothetical protein NC652_002957 [Populus alba x Populus x berolinensis]|nr:hypothetical protein NC652_002957 [Populus alba x Populus x berolinensis]